MRNPSSLLAIALLACFSLIHPFISNIAANEGVADYGQLQVSGTKIVAENGDTVQLQGMSLFWSQWEPKYYTKETLQWLQEDWCINVIRAAMAVESGGYLTKPTTEEAKIRTVVEAAIDLDMYVIIDWHDHNANDHQAQATEFFAKMARDYGQYPNVLYEIFNEPIEQDWDTIIKPYSEAVIDSIRAYDADNIIIVGSSSWSQDLHLVADNPITIDSNIAYTLHYYAGTHGQWLRSRADDAIEAGLPIFVTEYGTVDADGDGAINRGQAQAWWDWMEDNHISHCNWSVSDKNEGASIVFETASGDGNWTTADLRPSGEYVREYLISHCPGVPYFDCAGVEDGQARYDPCGVCAGGTTEIEPCERGPYNQEYQQIPGRLEVEFYDLGGEGVTYHDEDAANLGGWLRIKDGVDIEPIATGSDDYNIGWLQDGEWLEYTVDIAKTGLYRMTYLGASPDGEGSWKLQQNGVDVVEVKTIDLTGDWQAYKDLEHHQLVYLDSGRQVLRLEIISSGFNLGSIDFEWTDIQQSIQYLSGSNSKVYPNPAQNVLHIRTKQPRSQIVVRNVAGQNVLDLDWEAQQPIDISELTPGWYVVEVGSERLPFVVK